MFVCKFLCLYKMLGVGMIHKIEKKKKKAKKYIQS